MLDRGQRTARYFDQTGRAILTPRQRRRVQHKDNHQTQEASARREGVAIVRALRAERLRQSRLSGLVSP